MRNKTAAIIAALLAASMTLSGCGNNKSTEADTDTTSASGISSDTENTSQTNISDPAKDIADKYFSGDRSSFTAWKDIDSSKVIAYVDGAKDSEYFNITFGEFFSEYMYYLISYQIDDDMSEENKASCESYRDNIITFLTFERQYLYVGKNEYGISEDTLTDEQLNVIRNEAEKVRSDWSSNFYTSVSAELGEDATEEEITAECDEVLAAVLQKCGLDDDIFYRWELNRYLEDLIISEIVKNVSVTDDDVRDMLDSLIEEAKSCAEEDPSGYAGYPYYTMVYIPEGTRRAAHILLSFTEEEIEAISEAGLGGDSDKINELVNAAYSDELKSKVDQISERLANGEDFAVLREEFNPGEDGTYMVLKNSVGVPKQYIDALYSLENTGDVSGALITESGVYFVQYAEDAAVNDEDIENIKSYLRSSLESAAGTEAQNKEYSRWLEEYKYTVDYETLHIDASTSLLSSMDTVNY